MPTTLPIPMYIFASSPLARAPVYASFPRGKRTNARKIHPRQDRLGTRQQIRVMNRPGSDVTRKRVARIGVSGVEPPGEPIASLLTRPVSPCLWIRAPCGVPVDPVIPDCGGCPQALLEVARLEEPSLPSGEPPHSGQAVRLELESDRQFVGLVGLLLLELPNSIADPEQVLDVVAHLMCDHVGLCEVARRSEPPVELSEEFQVEVDDLVPRTVERPDVGGSKAAARLRCLGEQNQVGRIVGFARSLELALPRGLDVVEDEGGEVNQVPVRISLWGDRRAANGRGLGKLVDPGNVEGASAAEDPHQHEHENAHQSHRQAGLSDRDREAGASGRRPALIANVLAPPSPPSHLPMLPLPMPG